jgi:hypothetical protein
MRSVWQVKDAHTLRMLDEQGDSIASELNYELTSTYSLPPVLPGLLPQFGAPRANTRWVPLRIGKHAVTVPASQHEPWIVLEPKPRNVAGSGGCNRFTGSYDVGVTTGKHRSSSVAISRWRSAEVVQSHHRVPDREEWSRPLVSIQLPIRVVERDRCRAERGVDMIGPLMCVPLTRPGPAFG